MSSVSIEGYDVHAAVLQIGAWGTWWLDVSTPEALVCEIGQAVVASVGGVEYRGTVLAGDAVDGRAAYRIVGGAGGWHKDLPAKTYSKTPGVRVSEVLVDAAAEAGESLGPVPGTVMGQHFVREAGPAHRVLNGLAPQAWYVDNLGITQFGARAPSDYTGDGAIIRRDRSAGVVEIDTDDLSQLVPGVRVDGQDPATDVEIRLAGSKLTARVYHGKRTTERLVHYARIFDALDPFRKFRGTFEYRVVFQVGERLDLQIVRRATGLGDLESVPVRLAPGVRASHFLGSLVLVTFVDSDPSRPVVIAGDDPDSPGWMPLFLMLGAEPTIPINRVGDPVQAGPFTGATLPGPNLRIKAGV